MSDDVTPDGIPRPAVAVEEAEGPAPATDEAGIADPASTPRRRRRVSRWDRPKPPHDWRFWVGGTGRILMTIGILMFGFVAYQLWGTGIEYRQHQNALERQFERKVAELATSTVTPTTATTVPATVATTAATVPGQTTAVAPTTSTASSTTAAPATTASPWGTIELGQVIAVIEIPKISKTVYAVAGIRVDDLKKGLGHYPDTPLPGQLGNVAFAGHRTTYGAPLFDVDQMAAGDEIRIKTLTGLTYVYRVVGAPQIVGPHDYGVIRDFDPTKATLTLTSCHPRYSARKRIVVQAELDIAQSPPPQPATVYYGQSVVPEEDPDTVESTVAGATTVPGDEPTLTEDSTGAEPDVVFDGETIDGSEGLSRGWFSDGAAWPQLALWAAVLGLIAAGGYLLARRTRRIWVGTVVAIAPFVVTLYFFYQNVNRLLPPDL